MNIESFEELMGCKGIKNKSVPANQLLFNLGDVCDHFVFVQTGSVRVELLSSAGQQLLLYRIEGGQSCVMTTACLLGNSNYYAQAVTETEVELVLIPQLAFHSQLTEIPKFRRFVFDGFSERLAVLMQRTAELATQTIDQRLASALLAQINTEAASDVITLTHEQLAIEIGTAREVVSRRLAAFEKQGLLVRHRGHIEILDTEKLMSQLAD